MYGLSINLFVPKKITFVCEFYPLIEYMRYAVTQKTHLHELALLLIFYGVLASWMKQLNIQREIDLQSNYESIPMNMVENISERKFCPYRPPGVVLSTGLQAVWRHRVGSAHFVKRHPSIIAGPALFITGPAHFIIGSSLFPLSSLVRSVFWPLGRIELNSLLPRQILGCSKPLLT